MADIESVTSASNGPWSPAAAPSESATELIRQATNPDTGVVDTRRLAANLSQTGNFQAASDAYTQIETELSQGNPITAAQFSRDVVEYFANHNSSAELWKSAGSSPSSVDTGTSPSPPGLAQLLEQSEIRVSSNASNTASATASAKPAATPVDYGNIPQEQHWRYDRYLEGAANKTRVMGPNEWYASAQRAWANNKSGNSFEQQVRTRLGTPIGKGSKPVSINGRVPDLPVDSEHGVTDIKNVEYLHDTPQLQAFAQYAKDNKLPFNLIVGPDTKQISGPLLDNVRATGGTVTQFDPTNKEQAFSQIDIGESGNWKRSPVESAPTNAEQDARATAKPVEDGAKVPALDPQSSAASGVRAGALGGAVAGTAVSVFQLASSGKLDRENLGQVAKSTGEGAVIGAAMAKGEQLVTPTIDKVIGKTVQQGASKLAATAVGEAGADTAGVVARTVVSRVAGATVVGAAVATGISAWQNRAGLVHGDSKAIGNVVADTTVAAGSIAAATAAGAAIGSVVPVAGTAVGAVAGLAVGLAVTYGAQVSGVRNAIADGAAHAVDGIKNAAKGVSDAASSVAHFFGI